MTWVGKLTAAVILAFATNVTFAQTAPRRPPPLQPQLKPEARADEYVLEIGRGHQLNVLENDIGVPPAGEPQPAIEAVEIDSASGGQGCGVIRAAQNTVYYEGRPDCVGKTLRYMYRVKLRNAQTGQDELVTGQLAIKVVARRHDCDTASGRFLKIDGGTFAKAQVPAELSDIVKPIEAATFNVAPFCMTLEPVSAREVVDAIARLPAERTRPPELGEGDQPGLGSQGASRRMAVLYAEALGDPPMVLPTIEDLVGAALELHAKEPEAPKTQQYLLSLRTGGLLWTSSPCDAGPGKYFVVGPMQGGFDKLCYTDQRRYRTSFRLVYR